MTLAVLDLHCATNVFLELCKLVEPTSIGRQDFLAFRKHLTALQANCDVRCLSDRCCRTPRLRAIFYVRQVRRVVATRVDPDPALNRRWVRERGFFPSRATIDFALETRVHLLTN